MRYWDKLFWYISGVGAFGAWGGGGGGCCKYTFCWLNELWRDGAYGAYCVNGDRLWSNWNAPYKPPACAGNCPEPVLNNTAGGEGIADMPPYWAACEPGYCGNS